MHRPRRRGARPPLLALLASLLLAARGATAQDEGFGFFSLLGWYICPDGDLGMFLDAEKNAN
ncbi:hypothetical protein G4228_013829 [Cervus hanglu yarkandensis]|nr:hypothetical protein G4228_013829 [Cervus hanglu yarkandensis]